MGRTSSHQYQLGMSMLTLTFFMWGFLSCMNDMLIPHLKNVFSLSYTQALLLQFCFFAAYLFMSLPAAALVRRIGFKAGVVFGLCVLACGCLLFYPAAVLVRYELFLCSVFVLACGVTILQVSANPYVANLGDVNSGSGRLTLNQGFNSLGTTIAPVFSGIILYRAVAEIDASSGLSSAERMAGQAAIVQLPYLIIAGLLLTLALVISQLSLPTGRPPETVTGKHRPAWRYPHLLAGCLGIFVYVGAEVGIGSLLISFIGQPDIVGLSYDNAAPLVAWFWGGAMVGRFLGAYLMTKVAPQRLLMFNATMAATLVLISILSDGVIAMVALLAVGFFNSIMFPTIFALSIKGLGAATSQGSGMLCMFITGGALIPLLQGVVADSVNLQWSFIVPLGCYLYIVFFAKAGYRL